MLPAESSPLNQEWMTLQNNYEQYEKSALLIKLTGIALYVVSVTLSLNIVVANIIVLTLWIQEGIFRTFQSRLGQRILRVEEMLKSSGPQESAAFQLHSEWLASRKGFAGLIAEYARSAARPTVAFPYAVLMLIDLAIYAMTPV